MFEGLEEVDWSSFTHVYGPATDLPWMLQTWVGEDAAASRAAVTELWSCLFHQGELHPTAAQAAPFFVEALRFGSDRVFADAYFFLDHMIAPMVPVWAADGFDPATHPSPESYWAAAAGLDVFVACLDPRRAHGLERVLDAKLVSRQVTQTLWWFPQDAALIAAALRHQLDASDDPAERVPLLLCLAMQGRHRGDTSDLPLFARATQAADPGERLAGAMALARIRSLPTDGAKLDTLRSALDQPDTLGYPIEEPRAALALGEQLVSDALLAAVLPNRSFAPSLTPQQLEITEAVADRAAEGVEDLLEYYGL